MLYQLVLLINAPCAMEIKMREIITLKNSNLNIVNENENETRDLIHIRSTLGFKSSRIHDSIELTQYRYR